MVLEEARRDGKPHTKVEPNPSYGPKHLSRGGQKAPTKAVKSYTENGLENKKIPQKSKEFRNLIKKGARNQKRPKKNPQKHPKKPQHQNNNGGKSFALQNSPKGAESPENS